MKTQKNMVKSAAYSSVVRRQMAKDVVNEMLVKRAALSDMYNNAKNVMMTDPTAQGAVAGGAVALLASLLSKKRSIGRTLGWTAAGAGLGGLAGHGYSKYKGKSSPTAEAIAGAAEAGSEALGAEKGGLGVGGAAGIGAGAAALGGAGYAGLKFYRMSPEERAYKLYKLKNMPRRAGNAAVDAYGSAKAGAGAALEKAKSGIATVPGKAGAGAGAAYNKAKAGAGAAYEKAKAGVATVPGKASAAYGSAKAGAGAAYEKAKAGVATVPGKARAGAGAAYGWAKAHPKTSLVGAGLLAAGTAAGVIAKTRGNNKQ